jgi:hypothetical protein
MVISGSISIALPTVSDSASSSSKHRHDAQRLLAVQATGGLVQKEGSGLAQELARNRHALALSAAQPALALGRLFFNSFVCS